MASQAWASGSLYCRVALGEFPVVDHGGSRCLSVSSRPVYLPTLARTAAGCSGIPAPPGSVLGASAGGIGTLRYFVTHIYGSIFQGRRGEELVDLHGLGDSWKQSPSQILYLPEQ